jgi:diacylglycerol kinase (ATP)
MNKIAVLLNPSAGKGKSIKEKTNIEQTLRRKGIEFDLFVSESEEHLRRLAQRAIGDYRAVVAVGGDTTFKIIAGEILKNSGRDRFWPSPTLGMLGAGSANDIARSLNIRDAEALGNAICTGSTRDMDVGCLRANGADEPQWFLGSLSAGLGAAVNRYIEAFCRRHPRLAKFHLSGQILPGMLAVRHSFSRRLVPLEAVLQTGGVSKPVTFSLLVIANIPFYANGLRFHPGISPFDGRLEAVAVHTASFGQTLRFGIRLGRQKQKQGRELEVLSSPVFRIICPAPIDVQLDGDIISGIEAMDISLLPGALKVFSLVNRTKVDPNRISVSPKPLAKPENPPLPPRLP